MAAAAILVSGVSCQSERLTNEPALDAVTVEQFADFVASTGYVTDAERYGWSVVQQDVFSFVKVDGANWKRPDGQHPPATLQMPVTQVSYNDASAYCEWSGTKLPSYHEYWELVEGDERRIITNLNAPISETGNVNIIGNVWEITTTEKGRDIRLAGGSVFCSPGTCHGTSKERELYVDKETGNIHIGFAVLK